MDRTIFWSWQSDLDPRVTRDVIRYALDEAVSILTADLEEADRPSVTSDTQGVAGTPDIVATILRKIDEASIFIGDVTPIAISVSGKACANPNVLLEMGYANRALTTERVIQVWNTAFPGAEVDKLPFDMRGRRAPIAFHLPEGADTSTLRIARDQLARHLAGALGLSLAKLPAPEPDAVHWQPHFPGDVDLWFDRAEPQVVTNPQHGTSKFRWNDRFPGYARLIPSTWVKNSAAKQTLASSQGHAALVANPNALSYGISRGGAAVYWPGTADDGIHPTVAVTQWFEETGEFWGVGGGFLFENKSGRVTLATGYFFNRWLYFLERNIELARQHGGQLPIHVRMGVNGLSNTWWPAGVYDFGEDGHAAVEQSYEYQTTITSVERNGLANIVVEAFNGLAAVYGVGEHTLQQIIDLSLY